MTNKPQFVGERVSFADAFSEVSRGTKKFKQIEYAEIGAHPIVDQGKEAIAGYSDEESGLFADVPAIVFGDHTRCVKYVEEPFFAGADGVKILKPKLPGSTRFWWHALRATPIENLGYSRHFKLLKTATFKVVDEARQKEVVACLDGVLEQISYAEDQLTSFDSLVKSRFVEMFGDPVANPMGWGVSTIKKTAVTYGDGPFGSSLKSADYVPSGVRVIRLGNVMRGRFSEKDQSYVSYEKFESLKRYECIPGEVIIATLGDSILGACIVPDFGVPSIHKADCMYYETDKEKVLPVFAMCAINHPSMLRRALLYSHGQTRARINSTQAGNLPMVLPPIALQKEFVSFVAQVDKSRFIAQQQIEKLQMLYDSLAQEYFGD